MEIKVGDYVRSNDGYINKIKKVNQWNVLVDARDLFGEEINIANNEIVKSSPNIIDLIEIGDYVNGKKVANKQYHYVDEEHYADGEWCIFYENVTLGEYQYDIKSIVTKEQFSQMEYKIHD